MSNASIFIDKLALEKHPEGGWYKRTYQSSFVFSPFKQQAHKRYASTAIYYLLEGNDFSAFHRLKSDEMWHFYFGSPLKIYEIDESGNLKTRLLGNPMTDQSAEFQVTIPANRWFAADLIDKSSFSLIGCTVTPGFDFSDFELATSNLLSNQYPQHTHLIRQFTRS